MAELIARDVYLQYDKGPIQQFRAWNVPLFVDTQVNQGLDHTEDGMPKPVLVSVHTAEEFRAQRRKK